MGGLDRKGEGAGENKGWVGWIGREKVQERIGLGGLDRKGEGLGENRVDWIR